MLNRINKLIQVEQIEAVVSACKEADVTSIFGNFICGLPGQTEEDIERDIAFAKRLVDLAPERVELGMSILTPHVGTEFRINANKWGLFLRDEDFVTGRVSETCFAETPELSKEQMERLYQRFMGEVGDYILEKAAPFLTPRKMKELLILAAESSARAYVIMRLCRFLHVSRIYLLRSRYDYRFLFELPDDVAPKCAPVSIFENSVILSDGVNVINRGSPFEFELTEKQMGYYRCFVGKLSFEEIAQRMAAKNSIPWEQAFEECADVYLECEDCLAAITLV
jgi:hypothetical protein